MSEHQDWQRATALRRFQSADDQIPRSVRIAAAAAYVGCNIADVERWLREAGL